ncbi:hypothetical protein [Pseudoclavibacter helvolus]|uniref:hypothetical protein n=1 Tax=Pseudoclavibacter helvolus TaxID=255205 RepID=UPI003736147D
MTALTPRIRRLAAAASAATLSLGALTGCVPLPTASALTIAATATSAEPAASTVPIEDILREHAANALLPGDGTVTVVTPSGVSAIDLTPMRGDDVESVAAKSGPLIDANIEALRDELALAASEAPELDPIGVIDAALETTPSGGLVIVETSGYGTVDPVDLNAAGDWIGDPQGFVDASDPTDLPDAEGKRIAFVGLGYSEPTSAQKAAGPAVRTALETIWLGLCARMKASECSVIAGPVGQDAPAATNTVTPVSLDAVTTHCAGQVDIDTTLAFAPGESAVLDAADAALLPIVEALSRCPAGRSVDAIGHSALLPGEPAGTDSGLELDRAAAILRRLVELGAPAAVIGSPSAGGQVVDNNPGGVLDEHLADLNRTVTLQIG